MREEIIRYGSAQVKIYQRGNGKIALQWREAGKTKDTTRKSLEDAREFAKRKVREIDQSTGATWVSPARWERLAALEKIAGGESAAGDLLHVLQRAAKLLGRIDLIEEAARFYATHGPKSVRSVVTLSEAMATIMRDYDNASAPTRSSMKNEWSRFVTGRENLPIIEITREMLDSHISAQGWGPRTRRNSITRWATFFRRARELELWPRERPIPTEAIRRAKETDKAPEIFTPLQGKILLAAVAQDCPRYLPYLLLAGWAGVRPSECLRLRWRDLDATHHQLHLPAETVGKTSRERWVPLTPDLVAMLEKYRAADDDARICITRSREELSLLARKKLSLPWPADVLRHSFITYRLQIIGDIYRVAEEAGNSPTIIREHYRRPIPPGQGDQWFSLLAGTKS